MVPIHGKIGNVLYGEWHIGYPREHAKEESHVIKHDRGKKYGLVLDFVAPERSTNKSYSEIVKLLRNHFQPKPSELVRLCKFYERIRRKYETVADFVADLSRGCNFGDTLKIMIRDRFFLWDKG